MTTVAHHIHARIADRDRTAIRFEDATWTWGEYLDAVAVRAAYLSSKLATGQPPHVGVLLENTPEFLMWLGASAVVGAAVVGINPTRRGAELARDITHTDCQLVISETAHADLIERLDLGAANGALLYTDTAAYEMELARFARSELPDGPVQESTLSMLLFTSGSTGAPKACLISQGRLARTGEQTADEVSVNSDDVLYCVMPLFHSNCIITSFLPWLTSGATIALRRRFSASGFLPDVRKFGVTYFNYVGKPLSYILATEEQSDDSNTTLTRVFGNEATDRDIERFAIRFGCTVRDGYGSTEGGAVIDRSPDMPKGALGMAPDGVVVLDPDTLKECPPAQFDSKGRLLNPGECIGEIVNMHGATGFEGYYKNAEANAARVRHGYYWTGDLGYRDRDGWFYFAGRDYEWLRVDGENFAAAPIERIIARYPGVLLAAVYAVPDEEVGDQVMAALEFDRETTLDPTDFDTFLSEQPDLGTKWAPRFVRIMQSIPLTESQKPVKRQLRRERWDTPGEVLWRPRKGEPLRPLTDHDRSELYRRFEAGGRLELLDLG